MHTSGSTPLGRHRVRGLRKHYTFWPLHDCVELVVNDEGPVLPRKVQGAAAQP